MNDKSLKAKACTEYVGEPNYVKFKYKGFDCEIKRHEYLLTLCGYASFRAKHSINNEQYRNALENIDVHGGVTYFEISPSGKVTVGFDCAHYNDLSPTLQILEGKNNYQEYRTVDFVKREIQKMVDQIININDQLSAD